MRHESDAIELVTRNCCLAATTCLGGCPTIARDIPGGRGCRRACSALPATPCTQHAAWNGRQGTDTWPGRAQRCPGWQPPPASARCAWRPDAPQETRGSRICVQALHVAEPQAIRRPGMPDAHW